MQWEVIFLKVIRTFNHMNLQGHLKCLSALSLRQQGPESQTRFWECRGQRSSGCLGEWQKSEFPGNIPGKVQFEKNFGDGAMTPLLGPSFGQGWWRGWGGGGWGLCSLHLARWWLTRINFNTLSQTTWWPNLKRWLHKMRSFFPKSHMTLWLRGIVILIYFIQFIGLKLSSFVNMSLVFLLAVCANSLTDSFRYKYTSWLWSLILSNYVDEITWLEIIFQSSVMDFWTVTFSNWP